MMAVQRSSTPYMRRSDMRVNIPLTREEEQVFYGMTSHASPSTSTASSSPKASEVVSSFEEDVALVPEMEVGEDQLFAAYAAEVPPSLSEAWDAYDPSCVNSMSPTLKQSATSGRHGVKRPLERTHSPSKSMPPSVPSTRRTSKKPTASSSSTSVDVEHAKKIKVSRERQLKINAASRRCRKKQKLELQFLRTHVVELQHVLKEQVDVLRKLPDQMSQQTKLSMILTESRRQVDVMGSSGRTTTNPNPIKQSMSEEEGGEDEGSSMSAERRQSLLHIASFMRNTMALESLSFTPEVIACLPIQMDGWHLRLAITEKNYTIHNTKFFPCRVSDLYAFGWETLITSGTITGMMGNPSDEYSVVTPLDQDVAHVYSKTVGKWSLSVHGVANVSYSSLVSRSFNQETQRGMICQQSVLEDKDFQDETTIPWLCKRWVVFQSQIVDGIEGTQVEAYRTASYATGRRIYKEENTYDSFCEHLIRRYAESNALLERMMARDVRFQHMHPNGMVEETIGEPVTSADRVVKSLLLF